MLPCMMEIFLSAVLGELASRSINFFISKSSKPSVMVVADRLQRALLRAQVIVDEAMERQITNQVVLQQLDMLRDAMYRGYYILNTFKYQSQSGGGERSGHEQFFISVENKFSTRLLFIQ